LDRKTFAVEAMKRALELAPRDNGETLDENNYPEGLLNRLAEGPEMPPETSAAEQEAVRKEWSTAVENIRNAPKRCKNSIEDIERAHRNISGNTRAESRVVELQNENPNMTWGDAIVQADKELRCRTGETEGLSNEANFLRHLKNLGHEDVESSALERGGLWEKAAKELQAHESRS